MVAAVSDTPLGPFVRQGVSIPPWSHNPEAIRTPDGQYVIYTLGPGFGLKKEQNCSKVATMSEDLNPACPVPRQDTDFEGCVIANATPLHTPLHTHAHKHAHTDTDTDTDTYIYTHLHIHTHTLTFPRQ